jgi:precorrin-3B methylase
MKADQEKAEREEQIAQVEEVARTKRADESEERRQLAELKEAMSPEEREELRAKALEELREMGIYNDDMITDVLIGIQENNILRETTDQDTENEQ